MRGITRELTLSFALGYDPFEFAETLRRIAEGELNVAPLVTGSVGIDGVPGAFADLVDPDAHAKIVEPGLA
jgi:threonine dehydrogenase-like Zn-dependent dehydrogenase